MRLSIRFLFFTFNNLINQAAKEVFHYRRKKRYYGDNKPITTAPIVHDCRTNRSTSIRNRTIIQILNCFFFHRSTKYPSIKNDLAELFASLAEQPEQGTPLGNSFFKIRMAIGSKGKGKSGGARVVTLVKVIATTVYLASIYDKSEQDTISDKELETIFKMLK